MKLVKLPPTNMHSASASAIAPQTSTSAPDSRGPHAAIASTSAAGVVPDAQADGAPRFDQFCFEAEDQHSLILNYAGVLPLLQVRSCEDVLKEMVRCVRDHMQHTQKSTFTLHLFCHGMRMRGMNQIKRFMLLFAQMFKEHFPTELEVCNVHHAPSFFASVYDLLRPVLPKASRDKIVIVKTVEQTAQQ